MSDDTMPVSDPRAATTSTLQSFESGDEVDLNVLVSLVYGELREVAHRHLLRERAGHTLQTTALVNEAYIRLIDDEKVSERGRAYFFGAAARAMRQILVDHARRRGAAKRGGDRRRVEFDEIHVRTDALAAELLDLDGALDELRTENDRAARVVECRFFGGLTVEETARALDVSIRTVKYDWALARAWLYDRLRLPGQREADTQ